MIENHSNICKTCIYNVFVYHASQAPQHDGVVAIICASPHIPLHVPINDSLQSCVHIQYNTCTCMCMLITACVVSLQLESSRCSASGTQPCQVHPGWKGKQIPEEYYVQVLYTHSHMPIVWANMTYIIVIENSVILPFVLFSG